MKSIKTFAVVTLWFLLVLGVPRYVNAAEYESSVVASVNGIPVTLYDVVSETFRDEMNRSAAFLGSEFRKKTFEDRKKALEEIIDRKIIYEEFKAAEYKIPDQYIENLIDVIASDAAGGDRKALEKKLAESGMTLDQLREKAIEKASVDIMINEFCSKTVNVTPSEVYEYYEKNVGEFSEDAKVELQILFLNRKGRNKDNIETLPAQISKDCEKADESIFSTMVRLYSDGPGVEKDGKTGFILEKNIRPEFRRALQKIEIGEKAGPISTDEGIYFIRVSAKTDRSVIPFEAARDELHEKLLAEKKKKAYEAYIAKLRQKAVIHYYE